MKVYKGKILRSKYHNDIILTTDNHSILDDGLYIIEDATPTRDVNGNRVFLITVRDIECELE